MDTLALPIVELSGTPAEMGRSYGGQLAGPISGFVAHRLAITGQYLRDRGFAGEADLLAVGEAGLAVLEGFDGEGFAELVATAEAAGVEPAGLFAAANYSDVRDVVLLAGGDPSDEGCTAFALSGEVTTSGEVIAGQTWDLHPRDMEHVIAVHRRPTHGARTVAITTVGSPTLIGLNEHGVYVGTTNIKVRGVRGDGVGYLNVLHRALSRAKTAEEASALMSEAPRLAAHTYWGADARGAIELEASAGSVVRRALGGGTPWLVQTNHCLDPEHVSREAEAPSESSSHRLSRATDLVGAGAHDVASLRALMGDRAGAPNCISRWHEDGQYAATNACAIAEPARGVMHACRGPADRGEWVELRP
ncbi:MAG: C45 family peptidase [Planctomycetota bacterium]